MYKSKLQELCHQKRWGLPKYSCIKDGVDHKPQFRASVSVNGVTLNTPCVCKSSKEAHNEAAKLAFLHFTSDNEPTSGGPKIEETNNCLKINSNPSGVNVDLQCPYKMLLQSYAQRKNLELPLYSSKSEGLPHDLYFKATLAIDGHSFESPGFFKTQKQAEHAAARVALMSLSPDAIQQNDSFYKNLLQQLAQNEGFFLPIYKTTKCGEPHNPTFCSTVEVEGMSFHGKTAKSRKQAELNAAKAAYTALVDSKSSEPSDFTSPSISEDKSLIFTPGSDFLTTVDPNPKGNLKSRCLLVSTPPIKCKEQDKLNEYQQVVPAEDFLVNAKVSSQELPSSPKEGQSSAAMTTPPDLSVLPIADSNVRMTKGMKSFLLCDRVRVYTCIPDTDFRKGIVVLPISEDKWVAVSLEFPNEKDA